MELSNSVPSDSLPCRRNTTIVSRATKGVGSLIGHSAATYGVVHMDVVTISRLLLTAFGLMHNIYLQLVRSGERHKAQGQQSQQRTMSHFHV